MDVSSIPVTPVANFGGSSSSGMLGGLGGLAAGGLGGLVLGGLLNQNGGGLFGGNNNNGTSAALAAAVATQPVTKDMFLQQIDNSNAAATRADTAAQQHYAQSAQILSAVDGIGKTVAAGDADLKFTISQIICNQTDQLKTAVEATKDSVTTQAAYTNSLLQGLGQKMVEIDMQAQLRNQAQHCAILTKISEDGALTRALINDNTVQDLRDKNQTLTNALLEARENHHHDRLMSTIQNINVNSNAVGGGTSVPITSTRS